MGRIAINAKPLNGKRNVSAAALQIIKDLLKLGLKVPDIWLIFYHGRPDYACITSRWAVIFFANEKSY